MMILSLLHGEKQRIQNAYKKKDFLFFKVIFTIVFFLLTSAFLFSADYTPPAVKKIMEEASQKTTEDAVVFLRSSADKLSEPAEKRLVLSYLAFLQEQLGEYSLAVKSYAQAASLQGNVSYGSSQLSSEQLVLLAVRSALCAGDTATADSYMASTVKNSKNELITSQLRLYTIWSRLCKAETQEDLQEPMIILSSYIDINSMLSVRPAVLLTLWYLTGDVDYSKMLNRDFPESVETAVVNGNAKLMPSPFWYFLPRSEEVSLATEKVFSEKSSDISSPKIDLNVSSDNKTVSTKKTTNTNNFVYQQLGLFREEKNANVLVEKLLKKGFTSEILSEKRASGVTYYIVIVREDDSMSMGMKLKDAGFESYPVYPD